MPSADGSMDEPNGAPAEAAGSLPATQLPWQQIPTFDPQTTDLQVYIRKLQFLKDIWPPEHLAQLAPRAALQVQGVAFQKVARLDAAKLRSEGGVKYLVEALGGQWGKLASEEKLSMFEKALFLTVQKPDETNDSYLARHDAAFEDMLATGTKLEEIRAYILLRQSQLPAEDRKRIVVETQGELTYEGARKSLRLLGSKFFQELQTGTKSNKYRTYDINTTEAVEETAMWVSEADAYDEDAIVQFLQEAGDEDAAFIMDFEETVIDAVQDSPELASCYHTYLEARTRLRERAKYRGFWATATGQKGKGKKGKGSMGKGQPGGKSKSLAERIASSACRRCGQVGHWKRECPLATSKGDSKGKTTGGETISLAEALVAAPDADDSGENDEIYITEMPMTLPEGAEIIGLKAMVSTKVEYVYFGEGINGQHDHGGPRDQETTKNSFPKSTSHSSLFQRSVKALSQKNFQFKRSVHNTLNPSFQQKLQKNLRHCCRKYGHDLKFDTSAVTSLAEPPSSQDHFRSSCEPVVNFSCEESAGEAVIDTGASRTVIGEDRVSGLVQYVSEKVGGQIQKVPSRVQFRFGNSGTLQSRYALCIPRQQKGWIRIEVVPGQTPFLVSNTILKEMGAIIDPRNQQLRFLDHEHVVALHTCRKNLLCVDIGELLKVEQQGEGKEEIYHAKCKSEPTCRTPQRTGEEDKHENGHPGPTIFVHGKDDTHTCTEHTTRATNSFQQPAKFLSQGAGNRQVSPRRWKQVLATQWSPRPTSMQSCRERKIRVSWTHRCTCRPPRPVTRYHREWRPWLNGASWWFLLERKQGRRSNRCSRRTMGISCRSKIGKPSHHGFAAFRITWMQCGSTGVVNRFQKCRPSDRLKPCQRSRSPNLGRGHPATMQSNKNGRRFQWPERQIRREALRRCLQRLLRATWWTPRRMERRWRSFARRLPSYNESWPSRPRFQKTSEAQERCSEGSKWISKSTFGTAHGGTSAGYSWSHG